MVKTRRIEAGRHREYATIHMLLGYASEHAACLGFKG